MSWRSEFFSRLRTHGARPIFYSGEKTLSAEGLLCASSAYARTLRGAGIKAGDAVGCRLEDPLHTAIALVGHYLLGVIHVPINVRYTDAEVRHIAEDGELVGLVTAGESSLDSLLRFDVRPDVFEATSEALFEVADLGDDAIALLLFTSGTTGKSKGVELSYRAVFSNIDALTVGWRWAPDDVLALSLPLFHVHGLGIGIHGVILRQCAAILHPHFSPESVVESFDGKYGPKATIFMGVPTMYTRLVEYLEGHPEARDSLKSGRLFTSGSAALSVGIHEAFRRLTGHTILERYGMSETMLTLSNPYDDRRPGTVGMPVGDTQIRIVDEDGSDCGVDEPGELWVRGLSVMNGYRGQPEATVKAFADGWFRTGDLVARNADGYVSILGRMSTDIIKSGGYKIGAREIEEVLLEVPGVQDIAVVGVPDATWGERVCAAVVLESQVTDSQVEILGRLQKFSRTRLADYKTVRDVRVVQELPRNAMGKVLKAQVAKMFDT